MTLLAEIRKQQHLDAEYVFLKLCYERAFQFVATLSEVCITWYVQYCNHIYIWGPLEFISYTEDVVDVFTRNHVRHHLFVDDKQQKKQQILIQKTYQFIKVVNGVSRSHKTANIFFFIWLSSIAWLIGVLDLLQCCAVTRLSCDPKSDLSLTLVMNFLCLLCLLCTWCICRLLQEFV